MTAHFSLIAKMGFNAEWVNPIQETGKIRHPLSQDPLNKGKGNHCYGGSLYATKNNEKIDDDFSVSKSINSQQMACLKEDSAALINYTRCAKELGLIPIYDLVLNQVSCDSEVFKEHEN